MATRSERNVGLGSVAAGIGAIVFALLSGLTTTDGGPDWVGIVTAAAGVVLVSTGLFNLFRHGTAKQRRDEGGADPTRQQIADRPLST